MFPNVRLMIAAVVASVVALSCGFGLFAAFRVNHEPLSRLATGAAPLQLAAGNPMPSAAMPADSFGNRFPSPQADVAGAAAEATPPQPEHDDGVEPPSAVASTTAPAIDADQPASPAPVAQAPAAEPDAKPDEIAATPTEPLPATPSETPPAATETAVTEPQAEPAAAAEPAAPTEQASQEPNPDTKSDTATTTVTEPPPSPSEVHPKAAHRHHLAAKAQRARQVRIIPQPGSQPPGIGGPLVLPPNRIAARPPHARQARAPLQPVSQPSGVGGPFVPPTGH